MPYLKQICDDSSSCASYVVGCPTNGVCAVIDPKESEIGEYILAANQKGTKITHIIETHVHADHLSGARKLSEKVGVPICFHESADVAFHHESLRQGQVLDLGNARIKILHTPGHTPESVSLLYIDKTRSKSSVWAVLTGDTLFVGDVGRLDLVGAGTPEQMYDSIFGKLLTLDDYVEIYPAHYAGSVCGKGMSPKTVSTIGYEKRFNPALQAKSGSKFSRYLRANASPPFPEHEKIKSINAGQSKKIARQAK
ncbi:MAG: MBL fold metallo-hydrolase [Nitrososphaerales archaeon]